MKRAWIDLLLGLALLVGPLLGAGSAQVPCSPGLEVGLALEKDALRLDEPLKLAVSLANVTGAEFLTFGGFAARKFELMLLFTGPHGEGITANVWDVNVDRTPPPPPIVYVNDEPRQVEQLERLPASWTFSVTLDDARPLYALRDAGAGNFSVKVVVPFRRYDAPDGTQGGKEYAYLENVKCEGAVASPSAAFTLVDDHDGDGYSHPIALSPPWQAVADCNDNDATVHPGATDPLKDCDPATPYVPPAPVVLSGTLKVQADKHTVGSGSRPGSTKEPLSLPVRVFSKGPGSCADKFGTSWQNYKSIWLSCTVPNSQISSTVNGLAEFSLSPGNYLVIGEVPGATPGAETYLGVSVGEVASGATVQKYLQLIVKADNKTVPGKTTVRTGSLLLIIEPEYVEWDGTQELYPFIFESVGEWGVVTVITPPEGFAADNRELSAVVSNEMESLQFTITDVGSEWVATGVTHKIKHKGKNETIKSEIGVKLSEKLSKQKGIGRFGKNSR